MNKTFLITISLVLLFLSGCSTKKNYSHSSYSSYKSNAKIITYSADSSKYNTHLSQKEYKYAKMNPYVVRGVRYYPHNVSVGQKFRGYASWYGPDFHGKLTSNGETYNMYDNTAAHKTFPMNTMVKVVNQTNGLSTIVRINDRGPFVGTRIIDLSNTAARKIQMVGAGTAPVTLEILGFYSKNKQSSSKVINKNYVPSKPIKAASKSYNSKANYALQIASFTNIEGAIKVQQLHDNTDGYSTVIKDVQTSNGRLFKVYLKGFKSEQEARDYKSHGHFENSFIVKED